VEQQDYHALTSDRASDTKVRVLVKNAHPLEATRNQSQRNYSLLPVMDDLDKPRLVILVKHRGIPITGGCSCCKDVSFKTEVANGSADEHYSQLETLFREHFRKAHADEGQ
jgi:hypothetical protein